MPTGIEATVDGGFATIDFIDQSLRGPALAEVIEDAGPGVIETITRDGPRRKYRMPLGNATAAGLLDGDEDPAEFSAGKDTGSATALQDADPNENPGTDNANWHTPVAEHTSANKYVGQVANQAVLTRTQVHTGRGTSYGGSGSATPHSDLIAHVKDNTPAPAMVQQTFVHPGAEANLTLGTHVAALGTDPGGIPDGAPHPLDSSPDEPEPEPTATTRAKRQSWPTGRPTEDWKRAELDAYALSVKNLDTTELANKAEVVDAIEKGE
jgi:hypothetical protein